VVTALDAIPDSEWRIRVVSYGTFCSYDSTEEKLTVPVDCLLAAYVKTALKNFRDQSGSYIGGYCT
jgi:hypothetical protein